MNPSANNIVITQLGMVSSLGFDAAQSCAASRAGITRVSAFESFSIFNDETKEPELVNVHEIPFLTNGFEGAGRLVCIGIAALDELLMAVDVGHLNLSKMGFILALPDPDRVLSLVADDEKNGSIARQGAKVESVVSQKLLKLSNLEIPSSHCKEYYTGNGGFIEAIHAAVTRISAGEIERCIVGGIDSLLDRDTLEWLNKTKKLKTADNPAGLLPGEAGVFILLERQNETASQCTGGSVVIKSLAFGNDNASSKDRAPILGNMLSNVITDALTKAEIGEVGVIIGDQNGEPCRAYEWGNAVMRLSSVRRDFARTPVWDSCASFGDTGVANSAVAVCMAMQGFARGYIDENNALIWSSDDLGKRGAICLEMMRGDENV